MHVIRLGRYPVKSFQGEELQAADVTASGVDGDRRWAVVDQATGKAVSAKREGRLLEAAAVTHPNGAVFVTLPDGTNAPAGDPELDKAVAAWLDRDVRVQHATAPTTYEMNVDNTDEASALVDIPCPPGTFLDFGAVHLLTTASLGDWSVHRFRPTVFIESDESEDDWVGRTVTIGGVVLQPFMPTVRCVMVTRPQSAHDLDRDLDVIKAVNKDHNSNLGVYAVVVQPGRIEVGQPVAVS